MDEGAPCCPPVAVSAPPALTASVCSDRGLSVKADVNDGTFAGLVDNAPARDTPGPVPSPPRARRCRGGVKKRADGTGPK